MSVSNAIRQLLPPADPRTPEQVDRDIEDEFAFHLAMLEDAERAAGADPNAARSRALKRFGDVARWRHRCRRIALKERAMLQRINFALTIILMLVVIGVSAQVSLTQRYNTLALQDITTQIGKMRYEAESAAREPAQDNVAGAVESTDDAPATIDYDMRNLVGIWRLVSEGEYPPQLRTIQIGDAQPKLPPGMVKTYAEPVETIYFPQKELRFHLQFHDTVVDENDTAALEVTVVAQQAGQRQYRSQARPKLQAKWSAQNDDTIALHLEALLDAMTATVQNELQQWIEEPLRFERVTVPYTKRIADGPPGHVHVIGIGEEPQRFAIPEHGHLSAQDVLRRAGFAEMEHVEAMIWQMTDDGPKYDNRFEPAYLDPALVLNWEPMMLQPDAVIIVVEHKEDEDPIAAARERSPGVIDLAGAAERPGTYNLPRNTELTVSRLLAVAGVDVDREGLVVTIRRKLADETEETVLDAPIAQLGTGNAKDVILQPNDLVTVKASDSDNE